ncbi:helix-turn-helix transcriptional regulator [Escherichia coli]|nr:helix-turn-helix transcriptional regulator [Escherichia coli]
MGYVNRYWDKNVTWFTIKEERNRLGFSQSEFAELVGASYKSQLRWEKDESAPGADALAIWATLGLDVLYVVTGQRGDATTNAIPKMSPDKQKLMDAFDEMTPEQRRSFLEVGRFYTQPKPGKIAG